MRSVFVLIAGLLAISGNLMGKITPARLTCEYLKNPGVVDVRAPRFSWVNIAENGERDQLQTAYEIRVAPAGDLLASGSTIIWQSGKIRSGQSVNIGYSGPELQSGQECWWQVRVWDSKGRVSEWSEPAFWRMGLLKPSDWKAKWIGAPWQGEEALPKPSNPGAMLPALLPPPAPLFRHEFSVPKKVSRAIAFVTGLGYFELYLNGRKVGDDVLVPNQTNYGKRPELPGENIPLPDNFREYKVMYLAYDVTTGISAGRNAIGATVGNGFYNPAKYWCGAYGSPRFIMQ
nr:alpha-L-rhamnosidase N-terminal domain-containing protein [Bacteroidales bacterium]